MRTHPTKRRENPGKASLPVSRAPELGEWLMTTRAGAEQDLVEELALTGHRVARVFGPALVVSPTVPRRDGRVELTFARQGFQIESIRAAPSIDALGSEIAQDIAGRLSTDTSYAMHVWVPDTDAGNLLSEAARELRVAIEARLSTVLPNLQHRPSRELFLSRRAVACVQGYPGTAHHGPPGSSRKPSRGSVSHPSREKRAWISVQLRVAGRGSCSSTAHESLRSIRRSSDRIS